MIDVIKAQLDAAAASVAAARALMDFMHPTPQQAAQVDATMTALREPAAPTCCEAPDPLPVPGFNGTVCNNCSHNEGSMTRV